MSTGYLVEWRSAAVVNGIVIPVPAGLPLRKQAVTFSTSAAFTNAIGADCQLAELWADGDACWEGGVNPTAVVATSAPLTAKTHYFFQPPPGGTTKIALIDYA